ncbi:MULTISPECIES: gliding motility-associated C-terminal domain-containing protein [unclassified Cellulophaga]|uniref:T9SS type B sorting domain-containing protein n=1 Tax=unclassified Cellulophaga TaxID=2634405 RepID=UPI0026E1B791|nr:MULTISPECIES: gliding motility-associated C-terminal domain-containing protein [unclassified Cellulophaga]MDO6490314.1 gliding motility-associated C-terminal domain-containing protein [Cellulophaga sp. 2_MG-2023]MDO6494492.1 gliding motility-associated C-terminal domain-containing protein [Cellulophaga sp. 3_MG-2023]
MKIKQLDSFRIIKKHKAYCFLVLFLCFGFFASAQQVSVQADANAAETGSVSGSFRISRTGNTFTGLRVNFTISGTATNGVDYNTVGGSILIPVLSRSVSLDIEGIVDDTLIEGDESVIITISENANYDINPLAGSDRIAIIDNEPVCATTPNAPELRTGEETTFCDSFTKDLNDYVSSVTPAGTVLTWSSSDDLLDDSSYYDSSVIGFSGEFYGFYLDEANNCVSPPLKITIVQNNSPTVTGTSVSRCGEGVVTLSGTTTDGSLLWYDAPTGGALVHTGLNFDTPILATTTSYYVEATANSCTSARVEVVATINDQPSSGTGTNTTACSLPGNGRVTVVNLDDQLTDADAGEWTLVSQPASSSITIDANSVDFANQPLGEYQFTYITTGFVAPCEAETTTITVTVVDCAPTDTDLSVVKTVDKDEVFTGEDVTFTITVENLTGDAVTAIEITDVLNATTGFSYVSDVAQLGTFDSATGIWTIPELAAGESTSIQITATVVDGGSHINTAEITSSNPVDLATANNQSSVTVGIKQIDMSVSKSVDKTTTTVGDIVVFTITLTNETDGLVTDISVTDRIENAMGFTYVSHTTTAGNYDVATGIWTLNEILGNEEQVLEITAMVLEDGTHENTVEITDSFPLDIANVENNTASVIVTVEPRSNDECGFLFNQFSPNADGVNDFLRINCIENYTGNTLVIFNRLGSEVYSATNYQNNWDGTWKKGDLPNGTYFYVLDLADGSEVKKGWIQIIR